jgi:hypothetical protein
VILDNGGGMDIEDLRVFATYSLDQESRSTFSAPEKTDSTFISKFGVGAKEAGFYLGKRMRIITRKSSKPSSKSVLDYVMDEDVYKSRQLAGESVFKGKPIARPISDLRHITDKKEADIISAVPFTDGSFTCVVICLRDIIQDKLDKTHLSISAELSEIYRFQLRPELLPNAVILDSKFQVERKIGDDKFPLPKAIHGKTGARPLLRPLNIVVSIFEKGDSFETQVQEGT